MHVVKFLLLYSLINVLVGFPLRYDILDKIVSKIILL